MKIGDTLFIGALKISIKWVDSLKTEDGEDDLFGDMDWNHLTLMLNKDTIQQQSELSFCHELVHLLLHTDGVFYGETLHHEEWQVNSLSLLLHQVITQIVEWQEES